MNKEENPLSYKLFLDDFRDPVDCLKYMPVRIGDEASVYADEWLVVKDYNEFKDAVLSWGVPSLVSFDHDLSDEHYHLGDAMDWEEYHLFDGRAYTGLDCAKWLVEHCRAEKKALPRWYVHSMNPVGVANIDILLKRALLYG